MGVGFCHAMGWIPVHFVQRFVPRIPWNRLQTVYDLVLDNTEEWKPIEEDQNKTLCFNVTSKRRTNSFEVSKNI